MRKNDGAALLEAISLPVTFSRDFRKDAAFCASWFPEGKCQCNSFPLLAQQFLRARRGMLFCTPGAASYSCALRISPRLSGEGGAAFA